jgi:Beta-lactamase
MRESSYEQPLAPAMTARAAIGHFWDGAQIPGGSHVYPEMAAAGLWTTAGDLALLGVDVMQTLRGGSSRLGVKQETIAKMVQPQLPGQKIGNSFAGLGWFCDGKDDGFSFGADGGNTGFLARIRVSPARGSGLAIMINSHEGWPLLDEIQAAVGREYGWPQAKDAPPTADIPRDVGYAGTYRNEDGVSFRVIQAPDALLVHFGMQPPLRVKPISRTEFSAATANLRAEFAGIDGGIPASMTIIQNKKRIILLREDERNTLAQSSEQEGA